MIGQGRATDKLFATPWHTIKCYKIIIIFCLFVFFRFLFCFLHKLKIAENVVANKWQKQQRICYGPNCTTLFRPLLATGWFIWPDLYWLGCNDPHAHHHEHFVVDTTHGPKWTTGIKWGPIIMCTSLRPQCNIANTCNKRWISPCRTAPCRRLAATCTMHADYHL